MASGGDIGVLSELCGRAGTKWLMFESQGSSRNYQVF